MDDVNQPQHYLTGDIECIDAIKAALGETGFRTYCRGNAIKYLWRCEHKLNAAEDLKKAVWYGRMANGDDPRDRPEVAARPIPGAPPEAFAGRRGGCAECANLEAECAPHLCAMHCGCPQCMEGRALRLPPS